MPIPDAYLFCHINGEKPCLLLAAEFLLVICESAPLFSLCFSFAVTVYAAYLTAAMLSLAWE